jgi:hypothetical protein
MLFGVMFLLDLLIPLNAEVPKVDTCNYGESLFSKSLKPIMDVANFVQAQPKNICDENQCKIMSFTASKDVSIYWDAKLENCSSIKKGPLKDNVPKILCSKMAKKDEDPESKVESPKGSNEETEATCKAKVPPLTFDENKKVCISEALTSEEECNKKIEADVDENGRPLNTWSWDSTKKECKEKEKKEKEEKPDETDELETSSKEKTPTVYPKKSPPGRFVPIQIPSRQCFISPWFG